MTVDIVNVRFEIRIPKEKWLAKLNKEFSHLDFNIVSNFLIGENLGNTLFEIKGVSLNRFMLKFKDTLSLSSFQILHQGDDSLLLNVKTKDPWILNALVKTELLFLYPLNVIDGIIEVNAIAERKKIDHFLSELEQKDIRYKIKKIGQYQPKKLLSVRQSRLLMELYKKGYYEIPRKISLTELAKKHKISPSALSESIRRLHKKIAKNHLT
jgi:hypothetical protein